MTAQGFWAILKPHKDLHLLAAAAQNKIYKICYLRNKPQQGKELEARLPTFAWRENAKEPVLKALDSQVKEYFAGKRKTFDVPLAFEATEFQKAVWTGLMRVPFGDVLSYGDLASFIDKPRAARAIGGAMAVCEHLIVVPCHRVIAGDGTIGGFGSNLEVKRLLLRVEGHDF